VRTPQRLRVDWAACDGHGLCAQWAPELITLDDWGFPVIAAGPVPADVLLHARAAVDACPVLALKLLPPR
jgi:ferredoxin